MSTKNPSSKPNKEKDKDNDNGRNTYIKYTGLAFELLAYNLVMVWGGYELDKALDTSVPWFVILGTFMAAAGTIYYLIKKTS